MVRKDKKGRQLRRGEGYRKDRDCYIYQYRDETGEKRTIYAKTIQELREKEDRLIMDSMEQIQSYVAGHTTLNQAFDRYMSLKYNLKESTRANYNYMYDHFVRETIEKKVIRDLKYKDEIDGMKGFAFCNRYGHVFNQGAVNRAIRRIREDYNAEEIIRAAKQKRKPVLLPPFSCHHLRHTFCTRLCEKENNLKAIQSIMGHSDIQTTLGIYAEATDKTKQEAIKSLGFSLDIY